MLDFTNEKKCCWQAGKQGVAADAAATADVASAVCVLVCLGVYGVYVYVCNRVCGGGGNVNAACTLLHFMLFYSAKGGNIISSVNYHFMSSRENIFQSIYKCFIAHSQKIIVHA